MGCPKTQQRPKNRSELFSKVPTTENGRSRPPSQLVRLRKSDGNAHELSRFNQNALRSFPSRTAATAGSDTQRRHFRQLATQRRPIQAPISLCDCANLPTHTQGLRMELFPQVPTPENGPRLANSAFCNLFWPSQNCHHGSGCKGLAPHRIGTGLKEG